jgi:hypothetical protein
MAYKHGDAGRFLAIIGFSVGVGYAVQFGWYGFAAGLSLFCIVMAIWEPR